MRWKSGAAALLFIGALLPWAEPGRQMAPKSSTDPSATIRPEDRVDLNHASIEELLKIPGMTRTWAQRIIRFRPYRTKQDLVEGGILPGEVYKRIRDYVIAHRDKN
ncbi:MAG TPA: helix-hairpin-helix domain-containing protein [Terracidiphilus sp.]|nr:helix-hairpin-helix domain-containing protein [Terracidiphilus sp.]